MLKRFLTTLILFLAAAAVTTLPACAQSTSQAFTLNLTGGSVTVSNSFNNVGQSAHQVYACLAETPASIDVTATMELEASNDGENYFAISAPIELQANGTDGIGLQGFCGTLTANGYFAAVRLQVSNVTPSAETFEIAGIYSGSVGTAAVGGEVRASGAAQKVTPTPIQGDYINTALKSSPEGIVTPVDAPLKQSTFLYGVLAENPNSSTTVYVYITDANAGPTLVIPVEGGSAINLVLPSPAFLPSVAGTVPTVACATSPEGNGDPATGCVVDLLLTTVAGTNAKVSATGAVDQTDNSSGNMPY